MAKQCYVCYSDEQLYVCNICGGQFCGKTTCGSRNPVTRESICIKCATTAAFSSIGTTLGTLKSLIEFEKKEPETQLWGPKAKEAFLRFIEENEREWNTVQSFLKAVHPFLTPRLTD